MRLHWLEVAAFGPYPDRQSIDFDELGSDGVFLLYGDTGAGKTSLLDAIAYALYGSVPGARADAKRLRCDTADASVATVVTLELTVQGQRLRVQRSPEYERPKKHRDGVTKQPAKASLTWLDDVAGRENATSLTRIDEVGRTVGRLLGMNAEQFFQVVMLPQGEFARFLRSDTSEREKLLEKLFGTQHFADVENWFSEHRKQRRHEVEAQAQRVREDLARVSQVAGTEADEGVDEQTWLEELEKRLLRDVEDATADQARLRKERDVAERELTQRRELAEKVRRTCQANADLAELEQQRARHDALRAEKEAAERALAVLATARSRDSAAEERDRAVTEVATAALECPGIDVDASTEQLREWVGSWQETAGALAQLLPEVRQQESDHRRLAELAANIEGDEQRERTLAEQQAEIPARIATAREGVEEAKHAELRLEPVAARVEELNSTLRTAQELPSARQQAATASAQASEAVDEHQRARELLQDLRARRLAGMAAELAGDLRADEPCQVCGSSEHPAPAGAVENPVRPEDEERAQLAEQAAQTRREQATTRARDAEEACAALTERLGERTESELAAELADNVASLNALRGQAGRVRERTEQLAELETREERGNAERGEISTRITASRSEYTVLKMTVGEREDRLLKARGDYPGIAERRADLLDFATRVDRLSTARTAREDAERHVRERDAALREGAAEAGFDTVETALAAQRDEQRIGELDATVRAADERRAVATATLAELAEVDPSTEVDVASAVATATEAREATEHATARVRAAEQRTNDVELLAQRLRSQWSELGPELARFAELDALTDVVNGKGQNARRMSLRAYVLAARLEEVAIAASRRLQRMSERRYSFVHSDGAGARGTRGGLGLDVLDDYSGKVRPAKTLSGGESFLASLSLALGLADVVAAETGGALLDTLFIDEGFGSLDPGTLDLVMDTLDELRSGGRVIGLVSHVEEMRQRIGVRLRVRKSRSGSTLELET